MWRFLTPSKAKIVVLVLGYMFILSPQHCAAQGIAFDPLSWDFGDVLLGTSESVVFDIKATQDSSTTLYFVWLAEEAPSPIIYPPEEKSFFSITSMPPVGITIPGGTSVNVEVTFAPTAVGFYDAFLLTYSNAPGNYYYTPLQGNCVIPEPSSMLLACIGLAGLAGLKRKLGLERRR